MNYKLGETEEENYEREVVLKNTLIVIKYSITLMYLETSVLLDSHNDDESGQISFPLFRW